MRVSYAVPSPRRSTDFYTESDAEEVLSVDRTLLLLHTVIEINTTNPSKSHTRKIIKQIAIIAGLTVMHLSSFPSSSFSHPASSAKTPRRPAKQRLQLDLATRS